MQTDSLKTLVVPRVVHGRSIELAGMVVSFVDISGGFAPT